MFQLLILVILILSGCTYQVSPTGSSEDMSGAKLDTKTGWSANGNIFTGGGGTASKAPPDGKGKSGVSLQANFADPDAYTVQFNLVNIDKPVGYPRIITFGEVIWSVEGNYVRRAVSIGPGQGVAVTGVGQGARIRIYDGTDLAGGFDPISYNVSAQVSKGVRGSWLQPPFIDDLMVTIPAGNALGPTQHIVTIPTDCGISGVYASIQGGSTSPIDVGNADVIFKQISTGTAKTYGAKQAESWVPMSPGVTQIEIDNWLLDQVNVTLTYAIDG